MKRQSPPFPSGHFTGAVDGFERIGRKEGEGARRKIRRQNVPSSVAQLNSLQPWANPMRTTKSEKARSEKITPGTVSRERWIEIMSAADFYHRSMEKGKSSNSTEKESRE